MIHHRFHPCDGTVVFSTNKPMLSELLYLFPLYISLFWASMLFINIRSNCKAQNIWILVLTALAISTYCLYAELPILEIYTTSLYYTLIPFYTLAVMQEPFNWKTYLWLLLPVCVGFTGYHWLIAVQVLLLLAYIAWRMKRYRRRLEEPYSNLEGKMLGHLHCILAYLCLMVVFLFVRTNLLMALAGAVNFYMGYQVYHLKLPTLHRGRRFL